MQNIFAAVSKTFGLRMKLNIKKLRVSFFNQPHSEVFILHYSDRTITQKTLATPSNKPHHPLCLVIVNSSYSLWSFQHYTWSVIKIIRLVTWCFFVSKNKFGYILWALLTKKKILKLIYGLACWICSKCKEILFSPLNNHPANARLY